MQCNAPHPGHTSRLTPRHSHPRLIAYRGDTDLVVNMEEYTVWVESAPRSVLARSALLFEKYRLPTRTPVFILRPKGYKKQGGTFLISAATRRTP